MEKITKDNKGITLVSLIITIIIMSILVSTTTFLGIDTYKKSKVTNFVTEMQLIQTKVDQLIESKTIEEINNMGLQEITTEKQKNAITTAYSNNEISSDNISEYKVFTSNNILDIFEIEDIDNEIMVNIITREVVSAKGIEHEGTTYYTQYKLPKGQKIIKNTEKIDRKLEFDLDYTINGLNADIKIKNIAIINGTLKYKEQNDNYWNTITNYTKTEEEYSVLVSKSGVYEFILIDNVTQENSNIKQINEETQEILEEYVPDENKITLILANEPKTNIQTMEEYNYNLDSDNWAYVINNEISYLWIPRFAYKVDVETDKKEIKFLKGNSRIATDNTYINDEWIIHDKFKNNDIELTGIWVKTENQIGLDMITLLNSDYEILTEINIMNNED